MLSYTLSWRILPLPVTLETLSLLLLCLLPESALSPNHATLGRGIHSLIHWTGLNTQSLFYSVKKGGAGRTYDPGICVSIYVILHFELTNISIICNSWVSFPPLPPPWVCTVTTSYYIRYKKYSPPTGDTNSAALVFERDVNIFVYVLLQSVSDR